MRNYTPVVARDLVLRLDSIAHSASSNRPLHSGTSAVVNEQVAFRTEQSKACPCLFYKVVDGQVVLVLAVHVDDIIAGGFTVETRVRIFTGPL